MLLYNRVHQLALTESELKSTRGPNKQPQPQAPSRVSYTTTTNNKTNTRIGESASAIVATDGLPSLELQQMQAQMIEYQRRQQQQV